MKAEASWRLVQSKSRQEWIALENLQRQGYEAYLPLVRTESRRRSGSRAVSPAFPRYLFVRLTPVTHEFAPIHSTFGVSALVRFGTEYARVSDDLIAGLKARSDPDGVYEIAVKRLEPGDHVRVVSGPLADYECVVTARRSKDRVELLLRFAARFVRVSVPANVVRHTDR